MRRFWALVFVAAACAPACKKKEVIPVDTSQSQDLPREVAVEELRKTLPSAETISCTAPKEAWKPSEVKEWAVTDAAFEIRFLKDDPIRVSYAEIRQGRVEQYGRSYVVRLFTPKQQDAEREFLTLGWRARETAERVLWLIEALRAKR